MDRAVFLQTRMGLSQSLAGSEWLEVSYMVSGFPPVLWLSEENLLEKVEFLRNTFDFDSEEMRDVFVTYPQILGLGIETNLSRKVDFFLSCVDAGGAGLTKNQLKEFVLYQPALLAYSLEKRIKPRIERLQLNCISYGYAPSYLMSYSDLKFEQW